MESKNDSFTFNDMKEALLSDVDLISLKIDFIQRHTNLNKEEAAAILKQNGNNEFKAVTSIDKKVVKAEDKSLNQAIYSQFRSFLDSTK